MSTSDHDEHPPLAAASTSIDPFLAGEYARLMELHAPIHEERHIGVSAGFGNTVVPDGMIYLPVRSNDQWDWLVRHPKAIDPTTTTLFHSMKSEFFKPMEAGSLHTVRVHEVPGAPPTERVARHRVFTFELTDMAGERVLRQAITFAELRP